MHRRALELIAALDLRPHPEGGFFRETWRSPGRVIAGHGADRSALTTIYYLLAAGDFSAWHRVHSDETWHWYEGEPLELLLVAPGFDRVQHHRLGPVTNDSEPVATVPANWWQAARPLGTFALCGCSVAPGFEFEDFTFLRDHPHEAGALRGLAPELVDLLQ